jgi:hypothetical protein
MRHFWIFLVAISVPLSSHLSSGQVFLPPVAYPTGALAPNGVALGDLNGDGKLDVVVANTDQAGSVAVLIGDGNGTLRSAVTYPAGTYPEFVVLADFNHDSHLDVAVANRAIGGAGQVNIRVETAMGRCKKQVATAPSRTPSPSRLRISTATAFSILQLQMCPPAVC